MFGTLLVTSVQVCPLSRVNWTLPSLVPTQIVPGTRGDSAISMIVPNSLPTSPSFFDRMHGTPGLLPHDGRLYACSSNVRVFGSMLRPSDFDIVNVSPRLREMNSCRPPISSVCGLCGEIRIGVFQLNALGPSGCTSPAMLPRPPPPKPPPPPPPPARRPPPASTTAATTPAAARRLRPRAPLLAGVEVIPVDAAVLRLGVEHERIRRVDLRLEAITAADADPVPLPDPLVRSHVARTTPRSVVLQPGAHPVRTPHVDRHVVGQCRAPHAHRLPRVAAVVADVEAAVVAVHHVFGVLRIDPDRVVVDVAHPAEAGEDLAAVDRLRRIRAADVDRVFVVRVDADLAVIHRPLVLVRRERPRLAAIRRSPHAARLRVRRLLTAAASAAAAAESSTASAATTAATRLGFLAGRRRRRRRFLVLRDLDLRVDHVRIRSRPVEADASHRAARQSVAAQAAPRLAAVGRLVHRAAESAADKSPGGAAPLIRCRQQMVRIRRIRR